MLCGYIPSKRGFGYYVILADTRSRRYPSSHQLDRVYMVIAVPGSAYLRCAREVIIRPAHVPYKVGWGLGVRVGARGGAGT